VQTYTSEELHDTIITSIRRSLAFPLYRSFALAQRCVLDVATTLLRGKRAVLRALLETKRILDAHEVYYIYNKVWVDDFCVWVAKSAR
jgi:protein SHQ1